MIRIHPFVRFCGLRQRWLAITLLGITCAFAAPVEAQTIFLRDGQTVATQGLRRDGNTVLARVQTVGGTPGEIGYAVENIARIDFAEPAQLKTAAALLEAGKAADALNQITPLVAYYAPFRDVAGNWWAPLSLTEVDALARLGRDREVDALLTELTRWGTGSPELLRTAKIKRAASLERQGQHQSALALLEPLVKDPAVAPEQLVEGWLAVGWARLGLKDYRGAELAFLHVPVYAPNRSLLMAPALLGSARAYVELSDDARARATLKKLIADYPETAEAGEAKGRLQKLQARASKPSQG